MAETTRRPSRATPRARVADSFAHIVVENLSPSVDGGRFAAKRLLGDTLEVGADVFKDGHDLLAARVRWRGPGATAAQTAPLTYDFAQDRWTGRFPLDALGSWRFTVEAWTDRFGTWRAGLEKKLAAGQDVTLELEEGARMVDGAARRAPFGQARRDLTGAVAQLRDGTLTLAERGDAALSPSLRALMAAHLAPVDLTAYPQELEVVVERPAAGFASWYELFPRSTAAEPGRHGTFADAERVLPRIADLGFDVVYLPPIHPIGHTFRKGRNNTLTPEPDDVGSPWAIGNEHGGHEAVEPALGTVEDFERFVRRANELGLEIALDFALQCSPDHPWVKEHPDWFHIRPDGTIQYAENPPKKYQDIYPIDFWTDDREALWRACRDLLLLWIARGVKTFRVDNPHTKPFAFWEWVIGEVRSAHPDVVFLSEAFTRPKKLLELAKLGFSQSYTYFTWKNTSWELREWLAEFERPEVLEYYRGNYFANTPDILTEYLQTGGRAAFRARLLLAGTLSPLYGIYSGFELAERVAVRPGSEEYLDSEKYQIVHRRYDVEGNLDPDIVILNRARRDNPALQRFGNLRILPSENPAIFAFHKHAPGNDVIVVANLDPHRAHDTVIQVPIADIGLSPDAAYTVHDLLTGARYQWRGARNYVRLDPSFQVGHLLRVERA